MAFSFEANLDDERFFLIYIFAKIFQKIGIFNLSRLLQKISIRLHTQ